MKIGRHVLSPVSGAPVQVLAEPAGADWKAGGITIDWGTVAAVEDDTTLPDGNIIRDGKKGLRFGQVLCKITQAEVQAIDLSGGDDPNGGFWDITNILGEAIEHIAWNVSAATLQAVIRAALIDVEHADRITVSKTGFVYTINFPAEMGNVATITVDGTDLDSGGTITVSVGTTTQGVGTAGYYGPYDPSATDGRQMLTRGACFILNQTFLKDGGSEMVGEQNWPPVFDGGYCWKERIIATTGTHTLAAGPTFTELETVFPRLIYVNS